MTIARIGWVAAVAVLTSLPLHAQPVVGFEVIVTTNPPGGYLSTQTGGDGTLVLSLLAPNPGTSTYSAGGVVPYARMVLDQMLAGTLVTTAQVSFAGLNVRLRDTASGSDVIAYDLGGLIQGGVADFGTGPFFNLDALITSVMTTDGSAAPGHGSGVFTFTRLIGTTQYDLSFLDRSTNSGPAPPPGTVIPLQMLIGVTTVPEPASLGLAGSAMAWYCLRRCLSLSRRPSVD